MVKVNSTVTDNIRSVQQIADPGAYSGSLSRVIRQGGLLKADQLTKATGKPFVPPGTVFVDEGEGVAFKVPTFPGEAGDPFEGYVPVTQPKIQEIFKEVNIPEQTVRLNKSNIADFVKDVNGKSISNYLVQPGQMKVMSLGSKSEEFKPEHIHDVVAALELPEDGITLEGQTASGGIVKVNLKGYLAFGDMDLKARYGKWGYEFYLTVAEELGIQATLALNVKEEVKIPIMGVDIGFGNSFGTIHGGLFAVVGVDGKFTLMTEARQWVTIAKAGLGGSCFFYVPVSIGPIFELGDQGFNLDADFNGEVDGYVKVGADMGLSLAGLSVVGAGVYVGIGMNCAVSGGYLDGGVYGIVQAFAELFGMRGDIVNWQPTILHIKKKNTAGYVLKFKEACA